MKKNLLSLLRKRYLFSWLLLLLANTAFAQALKVNGRVLDTKGQAVPGVNIRIKNTQTGTVTTPEGDYALILKTTKDTLVFSFVGFQKQEIAVGGRPTINVVLLEDKNDLEDVVIVAYGHQKKQSMVSSITTINPKELKGPTSNLTTMLAGRIAGMVSYQRSGEPGADNANFFIRGVSSHGVGKIDPLILIDGMESTPTELARLQPDDIAGFSVLKDASASSLYGARGANGVILVNTKSGKSGAPVMNIRLENATSSNTRNFKMADNITYMRLANEAAITRDPLEALPYSQNKIDHTLAGDNPLLYPSNNWMSQLIKDYTNNQRMNINLGGGSPKAQYYVGATMNQDNGILKTQSGSGFNSNIKLRSYEVRSTVNLKLTNSTEAIIRTTGNFDDYNGPVGGGRAIFNSVLKANPVRFPAIFPASDMPNVKRPLFGNQSRGGNGEVFINPYAQMVSGFQGHNTSTLNVQLELKQDLNFLTPGLSARAMMYTKRHSRYAMVRRFKPFYYSANPSLDAPQGYTLSILNEKDGTDYLGYEGGDRLVQTTSYIEAAFNYNRTFNDVHNIGGMLIGIRRNFINSEVNDLQQSLPFRNEGISGRFTYGYDNRYMLEANFGYNGSERFARKNRYGFFPTIGAAWNVSSESFFEKYENTISRLKLRATYGLVGNDQIGSAADRFFYLSNINPNNGNFSAWFGEDYNYTRPGVSISRYPNELISWERATKTNLGMDLSLWNSLNFTVDVYHELRNSILLGRNYVPTTMGLTAPVSANVGVAKAHGIDLQADYNRTFGKVWVQARGTFTYAANETRVNEEPNYPGNMKYLSRVGHPTSQLYGYVAERLFVDDEDVKNSPKQHFGEVRGGDIKYRDLNGDGEITALDQVNGMGFPTMPEVIYGFGASIGYKNFDVSFQFQGSARSSLYIDPASISPFVATGAEENGLLNVIANDHWSEDNRNIYAFWPRLGLTQNENNNQLSSWWMRNGAFLRMKNAELGYNIGNKGLKKYHIAGLRFYASATNLFVISAFKMWDPEQGGNGLGYPLQRVFNFGVFVQL